jgi:hypothetical protein
VKLIGAKTVWVMVGVLFLAALPASAGVFFNDGKIHNIDYEIDDDVWVDYGYPGMKTTLNLLDGGRVVRYLMAFEDSRINILGGSALALGVHQNSLVKMSAGSIEDSLLPMHNSRAFISGGTIAEQLKVGNTSRTVLSGGSIGQELIVSNTAVLTIQGWNFEVDGQPLGYGRLCSVLGGGWDEEPPRHLNGTLVCGGTIDNDFLIGNDAEIVLAPPGDLDSDADVDLFDLSILARWWRRTGAHPSADIAPCGGDEVVDFLDLSVLCSYWLEGAIGSTAI